MNQQTAEKIERARRYMLGSELPEEAKDGLQALLDAALPAAKAEKVTAEDLADGLVALMLHEVRQAVRLGKMFEAAIQKQYEKCQAQMTASALVARQVAAAPAVVEPAGLATVRAWFGLLTFRVVAAMAVVAFGANGPAILAAVERIVK